MMSSTAIAAGVLAASLAITVVLGRAKVFGALAVTGFVLGALATAALFFLLG